MGCEAVTSHQHQQSASSLGCASQLCHLLGHGSNTTNIRTLRQQVLAEQGSTFKPKKGSFKIKKGRFRLDMGKKFFPMTVVRPWHRLPREAVDAPSLEVLKARPDGDLGSLGWWEGSLSMAGGLELDGL